MKKKIAALCAALCVMSLAAGCGKKEDVLDKNNPVTITVWNYYNGAQLDSFNELVEKFNSTVGKEKGIKVEAASQGSVDDLQKNVMDSIIWGLWWKNNRYDMVNRETIKMDKFDRL